MAGRARSSVTTAIAVAIVAYAACDVIHEVLGHGIASLLSPHVSMLALSSVALSTHGGSRFVSAAGPIANLVAGVSALAIFRRSRGAAVGAYFAWLLGAVNLLNGTGYLVYSGALDFGDWAVVIAGLRPHAVWRAMLVVGGLALYFGVVWQLASLWRLRFCVEDGKHVDLHRLVMPGYWAGGLLMVVAAAFNPIGVRLVWLSGAATGFGAMAGLAVVPVVLQRLTGHERVPVLPFDRHWVVAAVVVALVFVGILGPGIAL